MHIYCTVPYRTNKRLLGSVRCSNHECSKTVLSSGQQQRTRVNCPCQVLIRAMSSGTNRHLCFAFLSDCVLCEKCLICTASRVLEQRLCIAAVFLTASCTGSTGRSSSSPTSIPNPIFSLRLPAQTLTPQHRRVSRAARNEKNPQRCQTAFFRLTPISVEACAMGLLT